MIKPEQEIGIFLSNDNYDVKDPRLICINEPIEKEEQKVVYYTSPDKEGRWFKFDNSSLVYLPSHEAYYAALIERNDGVIPSEVQKQIRDTNFVIFGTGTTGGDIATMLAQIGAENITICDMDTLSTSNLNRQHGKYYDIGRAKVDIIRDEIHGINPYALVNSINKQITPNDVSEVIDSIPTDSNSIIFWEMDDRDSLIQTHIKAKEKGIPIFTLTDIGHSAHCLVFLYNQDKSEIFNGKISIGDAKKMSLLELMSKFISIASLPNEYLDVVSDMMNNSRDTIPQVTTASKKAGSIACETVISFFEGRKMKESVMHNTRKNQSTKVQKFIDMKEKLNKTYRLAILKRELSKSKEKKPSF